MSVLTLYLYLFLSSTILGATIYALALGIESLINHLYRTNFQPALWVGGFSPPIFTLWYFAGTRITPEIPFLFNLDVALLVSLAGGLTGGALFELRKFK